MQLSEANLLSLATSSRWQGAGAASREGRASHARQRAPRVPTVSGGTSPGQNAPGTSTLSGSSSGQLDGLALFNLVMVTLVELGAVFWVGHSSGCCLFSSLPPKIMQNWPPSTSGPRPALSGVFHSPHSSFCCSLMGGAARTGPHADR